MSAPRHTWTAWAIRLDDPETRGHSRLTTQFGGYRYLLFSTRREARLEVRHHVLVYPHARVEKVTLTMRGQG